MKMFGLKSVLAAGALALFGSQAGAITLPQITCPEWETTRYLTVTETSGDAFIQCLFAGHVANPEDPNDPYDDFPNDGNNWLDDNGWTQIGGDIKDASSATGLSAILSKTVGSLYGGKSGSAQFSDPGTYDTYAILMKFGQPSIPESWFIFEVTFNQLSQMMFDWVVGGQQALSHTSVWGKDPTTTVPLPAGGLLLLTALGGMALVRRRKMVAA